MDLLIAIDLMTLNSEKVNIEKIKDLVNNFYLIFKIMYPNLS